MPHTSAAIEVQWFYRFLRGPHECDLRDHIALQLRDCYMTTNKQPSVSVIIPTYNRGYCVCRAIDSVLKQTYRDYEIVIVDDGSVDDTRERVAQYGDAVRYLRKPNGGAGSARNEGLRHARGRYVAWLDSDDVWSPWKLDLQMQVFQRLPDVKLVCSDFSAVDKAGRLTPSYIMKYYHAYRHYKNDLYNVYEWSVLLDYEEEIHGRAKQSVNVYVGNIYEKMIWGNLIHTSTIVFKRELVDIVGLFDESFDTCEDYDFHLRVCKEAYVGYLDLPTTLYRRGTPDQLTNNSEDALLRQYTVLLRMIQSVAQRDPPLVTRYPKWLDHWLGKSHAELADLLALRNPPAALDHWRTALHHAPLLALSPRVLARVLFPKVIVRLVVAAKARL
jgi:glycosyltransferase involved in cell wall biosynthesis